MKKLAIGILLIGLFTFFACGNKKDSTNADQQKLTQQSVSKDVKTESPNKRYGYESGIIVYKIKANRVQTEKTVYFDNWGALEAHYTQGFSSVGGKEIMVGNDITIINEQGVFTYDLNEQTGTKSNIRPTQGMMNYENMKKAMGEGNVDDYLEQNNINKLPDEEIAGFTCEVYEMKNIKTWAHEGIMLKMETKMGPMSVIQEATKFQPDVPVDAATFRFPDGVNPDEFLDAGKLLQEQRK